MGILKTLAFEVKKERRKEKVVAEHKNQFLCFCRIIVLSGDWVGCCNSACAQEAIMGFWEDHVRCDELFPSVDRGVEWGMGEGR